MKPNVIISSCALGLPVRYNGVGKKHHWTSEVFEEFATLIPMCPEVSMGLGVPREPMRLKKTPKGIRLEGSKSGTDHTSLAYSTAESLVKSNSQQIDGLVMMGSSPTCGLEAVRVYDHNNSPSKTGVGIFAEKLNETYPLVPKIEVGRLSDQAQRNRFLTQVLLNFRFRTQVSCISELQDFHRENKYLFMAFCAKNLKIMGQTAANLESNSFQTVKDLYHEKMFSLLQKPMEEGAVRNSLQHIYGYLKKNMDSDQKLFLLEKMDEKFDSAEELANLILKLIGFENSKQKNSYIQKQSIFEMFSPGLGRNC